MSTQEIIFWERNGFAGMGIDTGHHEMEMRMIGIEMDRSDGRAILKPETLKQYIDRLFKVLEHFFIISDADDKMLDKAVAAISSLEKRRDLLSNRFRRVA